MPFGRARWVAVGDSAVGDLAGQLAQRPAGLVKRDAAGVGDPVQAPTPLDHLVTEGQQAVVPEAVQ
jgi:hypothetical protein